MIGAFSSDYATPEKRADEFDACRCRKKMKRVERRDRQESAQVFVHPQGYTGSHPPTHTVAAGIPSGQGSFSLHVSLTYHQTKIQGLMETLQEPSSQRTEDDYAAGYSQSTVPDESSQHYYSSSQSRTHPDSSRWERPASSASHNNNNSSANLTPPTRRDSYPSQPQPQSQSKPRMPYNYEAPPHSELRGSSSSAGGEYALAPPSRKSSGQKEGRETREGSKAGDQDADAEMDELLDDELMNAADAAISAKVKAED